MADSPIPGCPRDDIQTVPAASGRRVAEACPFPEPGGSLEGGCARHFPALAIAVLALTAFNLCFRLGREFVDDWDEALYATSAWEMVTSGRWVATTFGGALDYYNSKPPLNVWMIALSFKALGPGLLAMRLPSVLCAWATVCVLMLALRRLHGAAVSLLAGLVLATSFGFLYVHAGRSANSDAAYTLAIVLIAFTLAASGRQPRRLLWLGPLVAAAFLLKGAGVLMPLVLVAMALPLMPCSRAHWLPLLGAVSLGAIPVLGWAVARWQIDGWMFFRQMVMNDLVSLSSTVQDGHGGTPLYYLNVLQKHHYDWLIAALVAIALHPGVRPYPSRLLTFWRSARRTTVVLALWALVCLLVPMALQTKLPWYLNPFYPVFATGVAWLIVRVLRSTTPTRRRVLTAVVACVIAFAEAKSLFYSYRYRDVRRTPQGLLLREAPQLRGTRVYRVDWTHADRLVAEAMVGARAHQATSLEWFLASSEEGDYFLGPADANAAGAAQAGCQSGYCLYRRNPEVPASSEQVE